MPYRKIVLAQDHFYHVFNRGVARLPIFSTSKDYFRLLELINYYRFINTPLSFSHFKKIPSDERQKILRDLEIKGKVHVTILAFCLMNNHYHFLIKQMSEKGITKFMSNLQNSYAKYFNIRNNRSGPLFQPMFKAVLIETDEQLLHVSRYIHLNPSTGYIVEIKALENYPWSSFRAYLKDNTLDYGFVDINFIMDLIGGKDKYKTFVFDQADYQRKLGQIKHLMME